MPIIAVLFLCAPLGLALGRFAVLLAPLALAAALFAIPADEARADSGHPGFLGGGDPLHHAVFVGDLAAVVHLLGSAHRADVNAKNNNGNTPLDTAVFLNHASIVSALAAAGADVNAKGDDGNTPLHTAAFLDRASVVSALAAAGADVNAKGDDGNTPLHTAAYNNKASIVSVLLAVGVDVNAKNDGGSTPLHLAAFTGYASVVSMLIAAGADVNARTNNLSTPLHSAAYNNKASIVSVLLAAGADVNARSNSLGTPLRAGAYYASIVSALLAAGGHWGEVCAGAAVVNPAHYNPPCLCESPNVGTPDDCRAPLKLHLAAKGGDYLAAKTLLDGGADVNEKHVAGDAPLHLAARHGRGAMITLLLWRGADVNLANERGDAPLHEAVRLPDAPENVALVSLLLDKGADPNIRNNARWRPLDLAFEKIASLPPRRRMMAALLIAWGARWSDECPGGAIPNENHYPEFTTPLCVCPPHISEFNGSRVKCECPAHSHAQVNGRCLARDSAQALQLEIAKMRLELEQLRLELAALNLQVSLAADGPPEMLEEVAKQAEVAARGIAQRRNNFLALARAGLAEADDAGPAPTLALSDTEATCRMLDGEVQTHSRTGMKICSGIDHNDTFCIVGSASAFPCVGFFRHVRRCNDDHNRPALDPWHCAKKCADDLRARGAKCQAE